MQSTPRPLPGAPPLHLASANPADIRSYRPLPRPPVQSADTSSIENFYPHPPPALSSSSTGSSKLLIRSRPKLHISVKSPILRRKNSLDSLTVRTPAFRDPSQPLAPAVDRWKNSVVTFDRSWSRRAPHNSGRSSRAPFTKPFDSRPVFEGRAVAIEPCIRESGEGGRPRISRLEDGTFDRLVALQPLRLRPRPIKGRAGVNFSGTAARVVTYVEEEDSDDETIVQNPHSVSSIDLTNGHEFCMNNRKSWRSLLNAAKVAMKCCLPRSPKPQPVKPIKALTFDAKRVSQLATPLHRTWYKERGGWRWIERDVGEVLTDLRRLQ